MPNRLVFLLKSEFSKMIALRWNKKLFRNGPLQKTIRSITLRVEQNLRNAKFSGDDGLAVGTPRINQFHDWLPYSGRVDDAIL
jgi:hypothetical protein